MFLEPHAKRHVADYAPFLSACPDGGFRIGALSTFPQVAQPIISLGLMVLIK